MFDLELRPYQRRGLTGLEVPWSTRAWALAGAAVLAAASLVGGPPAPGGLALAGLFLLGSLYDETWAFDPKARFVYFRLGLLGLGRTRRWAFDEVEGLELSTFRRGLVPGARAETEGYRRARPKFAALTLRLSDGTARVLERRSARRQDGLERLAQALAADTGLPLSRDESW